MTTRRPSQMDVARAIRHVLAATGAHPTRVARHAGLAVSYFGALTRGDRVPSLPTLEDLADALGVPLFVLAFYGVDDPRAEPLRPVCEQLLAAAKEKASAEVGDERRSTISDRSVMAAGGPPAEPRPRPRRPS